MRKFDVVLDTPVETKDGANVKIRVLLKDIIESKWYQFKKRSLYYNEIKHLHKKFGINI